MPIVEIVVLVLPAIAVLTYYYNYKRICILASSLSLGVVTYFVLGIFIARILGVGRFYSVPFGGFHISRDLPLIGSALFWVLLWAVIISGILRVLDRKRPSR